MPALRITGGPGAGLFLDFETYEVFSYTPLRYVPPNISRSNTSLLILRQQAFSGDLGQWVILLRTTYDKARLLLILERWCRTRMDADQDPGLIFHDFWFTEAENTPSGFGSRPNASGTSDAVILAGQFYVKYFAQYKVILTNLELSTAGPLCNASFILEEIDKLPR